MQHIMSDQRTITGVDYDMDKIETASHGYSKSEKLSFVCSDITTYPVTPVDVILLNDVLHYLTENQQEEILRTCFTAILPGGK
jgi:chemotaxis methyl-accepting protein methylase